MRSKWLDIAVLIVLLVLSSACFAHAQTSANKNTTLVKQERHMDKQLVTAPPAPRVEKYLIDGNFAEGESNLISHLKRHPHDDQARFGLGMLQFIQGVERVIQDLYRYGLRYFPDPALTEGEGSLKNNPRPELLTYHDFRMIFRRFSDKLIQAESTLSGVTEHKVKLPIHFGLIRLDIDGDGKYSEHETLDKLYSQLRRTTLPEDAKDFYIKFDRGDVHWLRGYCNLLSAFCQVYLAYDSKETFDLCAHMAFRNVDTPYKFLSKDYVDEHGEERRHSFRGGLLNDHALIFDAIALIHTIRWQLVEPERMERALHHLENVVAQSNDSWNFILAETDDDHEWIPNPSQTSVIPKVKVTASMITAWRDLMSKIDKILQGKLLIAFWRADDRGVNLRRVFLEPRRLDLALWVQGTDAIPYLEKGEKTDMNIWRMLNREFGSQFPGFAAWFN